MFRHVIFTLFLLSNAGAAAQPQTVQSAIDSDRFIAGGSFRVDKPVAGDLFAAGGNVDVDGNVSGDAIVAGGNVRIGAAVGQSLYAAAGQLVIHGTVGRNARVAGGQVECSARSKVSGNVLVGGGQVKIECPVAGYVRAAGGRVLVDGPVAGDVVVTAGTVELGPNARIAGRLRYASRDEIRADPAALVDGGIERFAFEAPTRRDAHGERGFGAAGWAWSAGLVVIAVLAAAAMPNWTASVAQTMRARPGMSLLLGFVLLVCVPVGAALLLFTIIGVPLALLVVVLYFALLLIGYVSTGLGIGDWALHRFAAASASGRGAQLSAAAAGMLAVTLLARLPWVGGFVLLAAIVIGIGALLLQAKRQATAS